MKIKSIISSKVIRQWMDTEAVHTIIEIRFMTSHGVEKQRLLCIQDHGDLVDKKFKPLILEIEEDEQV